MARHLIIGDGTTRSTANPVEDGAVTIQKMSASGPTDLVAGESITDAPMIRIVGGGKDGKNVVSPWIYGRDVINYSGVAFSDAAAQTSTILPVTTSAAASKDIELKFIKTIGPRQEFFKFNVTIGASTAVNDAGAAIRDAYNALDNVPDWLNPTASLSTATVTFTGAKRGDVAQSGNTWDYEPVVFKLLVSDNPTTTQTYTVVNHVVDATPGYGDGNAVVAFEESQLGNQAGFYFRGHLPQKPTLMSDKDTNYDMYSIVATKDGSSASQINGVDNLIEINIALKEGDADSAVVESKLNGYFAGEFPSVVL